MLKPVKWIALPAMLSVACLLYVGGCSKKPQPPTTTTPPVTQPPKPPSAKPMADKSAVIDMYFQSLIAGHREEIIGLCLRPELLKTEKFLKKTGDIKSYKFINWNPPMICTIQVGDKQIKGTSYVANVEVTHADGVKTETLGVFQTNGETSYMVNN